jgi:polynucleotide 5'-hydroxyl-kinase GRC3/NOL9
VAYIDLDCGAPEMTPPGVVSAHALGAPLLGPPHLHHRRPALAFFQVRVLF